MIVGRSDVGRLPSGVAFHHVGFATTSIESEFDFFSALGYRQENNSFSDPIQGVKGVFVVGGGPRIELLENLPNRTTLTPWLNGGVKIYHYAYIVDDIAACLSWIAERGGKVVVPPVSAVAFPGRKICFARFRRGVMLEFIEKNISCEISA